MAFLDSDLLKFADKVFGNLAPAIGVFSPELAERVSWAFAIISIVIIAVSGAQFIRRLIADNRCEAEEEETGS